MEVQVNMRIFSLLDSGNRPKNCGRIFALSFNNPRYDISANVHSLSEQLIGFTSNHHLETFIESDFFYWKNI